MGPLLIAVVGCVVVVGGLSVGLTALGRRSAQKQLAARNATRPVLDSDQSAKLKAASRNILAARQMADRLQDETVCEQAKLALEKADKLVVAMKEQPQEIRRQSQFFNYYLPTITEVLQKFHTLEESETNMGDAAEKTKGHMVDMAHAFDLQYENMFKDEALDLTVDIEAMQMALKREGLID